LQSFPHVSRPFDTNTSGSTGLCDLAEVRVHEVCSEGDQSGFLLLDVHEVQHAVVENHVDDGRPALNFRQKVAHREHREASITGRWSDDPERRAVLRKRSVRHSPWMPA
jgi:hypothetical protein